MSGYEEEVVVHRGARTAAIVTAVVAAVAVVVSVFATWWQNSGPTIEVEVGVASETNPALDAPLLDGSTFSAVELTLRGDFTAARVLHAASMLLGASVIFVGLALLAWALWRLRTTRSFDVVVSRTLGLFGGWLIVATVLAGALDVLSVRSAITELGTSATQQTGVDFLLLPDFSLTASILAAFTVGAILIVLAVFVRRGAQMQEELDEVI